MMLPERRSWLAGVSLLLSGVGLVAVVMLAGQRQNIFSRAWRGVTANIETLRLQLGLAPAASPLPTTAKSKDLYEKLTSAYPAAEKAVIDLPALGISGQAFMDYNRAIGQTSVWSRLENLPRPAGKFVRLWLKAGDNYTPAGIAEWVKEGETEVAYSVFVRPGNLAAEYQDLVVSYDSAIDSLTPEAPVVTLKF
jgi:hypothetical protein